jgi:hypothetical protein
MKELIGLFLVVGLGGTIIMLAAAGLTHLITG